MAIGRQREPIHEFEVLYQRRKEHRAREERQEREVLARRDYRNVRQESIVQQGIGASEQGDREKHNRVHRTKHVVTWLVSLSRCLPGSGYSPSFSTSNFRYLFTQNQSAETVKPTQLTIR